MEKITNISGLLKKHYLFLKGNVAKNEDIV